MFTTFNYTIDGKAYSKRVMTHSVLAFNTAVVELKKIADEDSITATTN